MTRRYRRLAVWFFALLLPGLLIGTANADYQSLVLGDNPIGYWRLGESIDTVPALDLAGTEDLDYLPATGTFAFSQPGAIVGDTDTAVGFTPSGSGDAPSGSPSNHATIVSTNSANFGFASGQSFSFEYWIRVAPGNSSTPDAGLITKGYDIGPQATPWYLLRYSGGNANFFLRRASAPSDKSITSTLSVTDDQWHHVVNVYDAGEGEMRLYLDGALSASAGGVLADAYGTNGSPFSIANHLNRGFDGLLDEVAVYDSALTRSQAAQHYATGSGAVLDPVLNVDFGNSVNNSSSAPGGEMLRFFAFDATESAGLGDQTRSFPTALAADGTVDVTIGGFTHFRDYRAVTDEYASATPLIGDMVLRNENGTMTLTVADLAAGTYQMTTYHHSSDFGGGLFDLTVVDAGAGGTIPNVLVSDEVNPGVTSGGATRLTFPVVSDGSPIQLQLTGGATTEHMSFNGFAIERLLETETVLAIDFNHRGTSEATNPGVTEIGFDEFLLEATTPPLEEVTTTTRSFGGIDVTLSVRNENTTMGDRYRTGNAQFGTDNGGFFTQQELLRDVVFIRGTDPGDGVDVLIEGLEADTLYEVTIWSFDDGSPVTRQSDWVANGQPVKDNYEFDGGAVPPAPGLNDTYSFDFLATSDAGGDLLISGLYSNGNNPAVFLNALQVAKVIPEPTSGALLLIGLALAALAPRRRRG